MSKPRDTYILPDGYTGDPKSNLLSRSLFIENEDGSITRYMQYTHNDDYTAKLEKYPHSEDEYNCWNSNGRSLGVMRKGKYVDTIIDYGSGYFRLSEAHQMMKNVKKEIIELRKIIQQQKEQITQLMCSPPPLGGPEYLQSFKRFEDSKQILEKEKEKEK